MTKDLTRLDSYDFTLPAELIAQEPVVPRHESRLLVIDRARGKWEHRRFRDLTEFYGDRDVLVANNTRVMKARLLGHRLLEDGSLGGKIEFLMLEELSPCVWEGMFRASAKHAPGVKFVIPTPDGQGLRGELIRGASESEHGTVVAEFDRDPASSGAGEVPLPPYIERAAGAADLETYQTVYASRLGSAAAPTAGLHFTEELLARLRERGMDWKEVTLHVGLGTFRPVKDDDVTRHRMHEERYEIPAQVAEDLRVAKASGKRLTAVGTTAVRALESAWIPAEARPKPGFGRTSLFIRPGAYEFRAVERMITNFHLPKSTLLMLVCAFGGFDLVMAAYEEAVREKYRFFSYGDAMLIL